MPVEPRSQLAVKTNNNVVKPKLIHPLRAWCSGGDFLW